MKNTVSQKKIKTIYLKLIACSLFFFIFSTLRAEYLYLKDGQVIQGNIIAEDAESYTVKTQYQTKKILRETVVRIMYGERKMEKIFLLLNDGSRISGFLVDQDSTKVIIRDRENSPDERSIPKSSISQMSASEIVPLEPSIFARGGIFYVIDSGGSELNMAPIYFLGSDLNFQRIDNIRLHAEIGFARCNSAHDNLFMQFVPVQLSCLYDFPFSSFHVVPKISAGVTVVDFNDGEGEETRELAFSPGAGLGIQYELIARDLFAGVWLDYYYIRDKSAAMSAVAATLSLSYRF